MRKEDKEDSIGLTEKGSSGKEERDNEEEAVEDMTERESSSKTKGTKKHCKQTDEGGKFTKEIENSEEKENKNKHRAKIRCRFGEKCKYREQCEYRHSQHKESSEKNETRETQRNHEEKDRRKQYGEEKYTKRNDNSYENVDRRNKRAMIECRYGESCRNGEQCEFKHDRKKFKQDGKRESASS